MIQNRRHGAGTSLWLSPKMWLWAGVLAVSGWMLLVLAMI